MEGGQGTMFSRTQEPNQSDDVRRSVSETLKTADNLIRRGELDEAERCVSKAKQMDPKNIYAYAFQERISTLRDEALHGPSCAKKEIEGPMQNVEEVSYSNSVRSEETQLVSQPESRNNFHPISKEQLLDAARNFLQPEFNSTDDYMSEKATIIANNETSRSFVASNSTSSFAGIHGDARNELRESRDLKIQRMVKNAVEEVRRQNGTRKAEDQSIRMGERGKIKEIVEKGRALNDRERAEFREALVGDLEERIREAFRRKSAPTAEENGAKPKVEPPSQESGLLPRQPSPSATEPTTVTERSETLARYRLVLASVWTDGAASDDEISTVEQLRQLLSISPEDHNRLQKEVQLDTYVEAFKRAWNAGKISPKDIAILAELRERFHISMEEHLAIESRILREIRPEKSHQTLLVVDDDERLLNVVTKTLNQAGFFTVPFTTAEDAYVYLKETSPDLILCDVNLRTSTMGGFAFYEKIRELEQLREIPFIFLSGLTDEALVRTGKELGVDDYLSKPVSEENLIATIRGKLRRYNELKERAN